MGTWNNLQEGFTVDERLPDTLVDVAVWHVFDRAPQLYRQAPQIKKPPCVTLVEITGRLVFSLMLMPPPLKRLAWEVLF